MEWHWDIFNDNERKKQRDRKYSMALKAASAYLATNQQLVAEGKLSRHRNGARALAKKYNSKMLASPGDRQLSYNGLGAL